MKKELATFGAGCFWGVQYNFDQLEGVTETFVGYEGGHVDNPTYEQVCQHNTGHTEVVQVEFDSEKISYKELLKAFFDMHDPTTMNRQGPDIGEQYRSVVFYHSNDQKDQAQEAKEELEKSGKYKDHVVTAIEEAKTFYKAEEYHQKYFEKTGRKVCH